MRKRQRDAKLATALATTTTTTTTVCHFNSAAHIISIRAESNHPPLMVSPLNGLASSDHRRLITGLVCLLVVYTTTTNTNTAGGRMDGWTGTCRHSRRQSLIGVTLVVIMMIPTTATATATTTQVAAAAKAEVL